MHAQRCYGEGFYTETKIAQALAKEGEPGLLAGRISPHPILVRATHIIRCMTPSSY
jgi:hypothetical protein